ncbi:MAG: DUF418 domain-containing protein [Anaerolineales bacterium]
MTTATPQPMRPISKGERIDILDILRGFAIFGILAVNIYGMASPNFLPGYVEPEWPWYDELAKTLMLFFAEGKFYVIFSFLFGLGFSVQLTRAEAKGADVRSFYPRRLWILFGFGLLHSTFFFIGDILRHYALFGFALLAFRKRSNRTLLIWAGIFFVIGFLMLGLLGGPAGGSEELPEGMMDVVAMARQVYNSNSFLSVAFFQVFGSIVAFFIIAFTQGGTVMALFLMGLLMGRAKFFEQLTENRALLQKIALWGLLAGLVFNAIFVFVENAWLSSLGFAFGSPVLSAAYVSGLCLLSLSASGKKILAPIGKVGRMALSNYIAHSVICSFIFNGYGLGLYEQVGPAGLWGIVFAIYIIQIPISAWWLSRFQFGPLEWLWRSLTYKQRQPFKIQ